MTEHELIREAVPGLRQVVFDDFYRVNRSQVARALTATVGDRDLAEEATDEAFARAYARWRVVSKADNPNGWVFRVGLNWSVDQLRRRQRGRSMMRSVSPQSVTDPEPCPEVVAALNGLSIDHRVVVVLRVWLDWSEAEVASALSIPRGTVKSRLARALEQLREVLGDD